MTVLRMTITLEYTEVQVAIKLNLACAAELYDPIITLTVHIYIA
jgi:hypothetical protein